MTEVPFPFGGWLEEHPEGGFVVVGIDGSLSPVLTTYDSVAEHIRDFDGPDDIGHVIRIRRVADYPDQQRWFGFPTLVSDVVDV